MAIDKLCASAGAYKTYHRNASLDRQSHTPVMHPITRANHKIALNELNDTDRLAIKRRGDAQTGFPSTFLGQGSRQLVDFVTEVETFLKDIVEKGKDSQGKSLIIESLRPSMKAAWEGANTEDGALSELKDFISGSADEGL